MLNYLFAVHFVPSVRRTQVLDDESDYFASDSNQWLSPAEREKVRKKEEELRDLRHASRKDRKITLDFAGRQVIDEGNNLNDYYKKWDALTTRVEDGLVLQSWVVDHLHDNLFTVIFRLDETLKAMSNESVSGSQVFPTRQSGRSCSRDLVNPNIMQSAPEVGSFLFL